MRRIFFILLLTGLFMHDVSAADMPKSAAAPLITMEDAIRKAKDFATQHKLKPDDAYLQAAIFHAYTPDEIKGRPWEIRWQIPNVRGGTTMIYVYENDTITVTHGE